MAEAVPAILLAGGLGTRLRTVDPLRPKPMVLIHGEPFLFWLVEHLQKSGFTHFILSIGYKSDVIANYNWTQKFPGCHFEFCKEEKPLGTGGAVAEVFKTLKLRSAWVFNGDTLLNNPVGPIAPSDEVHYVCLKGKNVFDAKPNLKIEGKNVIGVVDPEKISPAENEEFLFDAGQVFLTRKAIEEYQNEIPCNLHTLIGKSFERKSVGYTIVDGTCYDIGTPQRLERFSKYIELKLKKS